MAIPWGTIKSLLIFFGPMLLPRILSQYRQLKGAAAQRAQMQQQHGVAHMRPLTARAAVALGLLAAVVLGHLLSAGLVPAAVSSYLRLPPALRMPENIFIATQSRLQTPTDVLFKRLSALRTNRVLTPADEALRSHMASLDSRLLYLQYGPGALVDCHFCGGTGVDAASSFSSNMLFYYVAVDLLSTHLINLVLIAAVTSPLFLLGRRGAATSASATARRAAGPGIADTVDGTAATADHAYDVSATHIRRWRSPASLAVLCIAALDLYMVATYNRGANARATRLSDLDPFFWTMRTYRGVACSLLLSTLAAILYWAATGMHASPRLGLLGVLLFGAEPLQSPAQRVTAVMQGLTGVKGKLNAAAIVKNTALRDGDLRARTQAYWAREVMLVAEAMEEREVVEGVKDALQNRIDIQKIEREAEFYAQDIVAALAVPKTGNGSNSQQKQPQPQVVQPVENKTARARTAATKRQ